MFQRKLFWVATIVLLLLASAPVFTTSSRADGGPNHRVRNLNFGVSGGNVNDVTRRFCCSGTLGALLVDNQGTQYILSDTHVLRLSGAAVAGQDISQPGLIDSNCQIATVVADFTAAPALEPSNVDAAIAQLRPGTMDPTGFIEDIGVPSSSTVNPAVGMSVAKSGRTTGFTTGSIGSINTTVNVQYQAGCGGGKKFTVNYTGQVVINSSSFSAGGDSGSLIVTNNSAHNPVALLYAGSSSSTIGNPINEVLTRLSTALGRSLSFVGSGGGNFVETFDTSSGVQPFFPAQVAQMPELPEQAAEQAGQVLDLHRDALMARRGVIGVGVGRSDTNEAEAAIIIYVDRTAGARPQLPRNLDGLRVQVIETDPFVAF
jgi:hypothetical protein